MSDTGLIEAASGQCKTMADGTLRITFDVEPRHAAAAFALFSAPGTPAVLGRLVAAHEKPATVKESLTHEKPPMGPLCKWAVMRCGDGPFQEWIFAEYEKKIGTLSTLAPMTTDAAAAHCVKVLAGVSSRRHLDTPEIGPRFKAQIMQPYGAWLQSVGAKA